MSPVESRPLRYFVAVAKELNFEFGRLATAAFVCTITDVATAQQADDRAPTRLAPTGGI